MEDTPLNALNDGLRVISTNPVATGITGVIVGATLGGVVGSTLSGKSSSSSSKSRKSGRRIKHTKRGWKQDRARRSKQKWEVAYQRRKRKSSKNKSRRGIHYTKNGQPYKIMSNGRARFIKRKGGKK